MKRKSKNKKEKENKKFDTIIVFKPRGFSYSEILEDYPLVFKCNDKDVDKFIDEFYNIAEKFDENYKKSLERVKQNKICTHDFDKEFKKIVKKIANINIIIPKKCYILD